MIRGIEQLYQQLAQSIQEAVSEEWSTARIDAIFYADGCSFEGEYSRSIDGKARDFAVPRSAERAFEELRKRFKEAGQPVWGQASFGLHSNGTFNMKWGYKYLDEDGNSVFDEQKEITRREERHKRLTAE